MVKIGVFIRSLNKGGAENQAILLTRVLSKKYDVELIVLYKEGDFIEKAKKEIKNKLIFIEGSGYFSKSFALYRYFVNAKYDFLFCYLPSNNIIGSVVGKLAGIKLIFGGIRGSKIKDNKIKMICQKIALNYLSTAVISNSYEAKNVYANYGMKREKIHVIHNAIDINEKVITRSIKHEITILTVARFTEDKDYKTALLALKELVRLKNIKKSFNYKIVGYGEKEVEIRNLIKYLDLNDVVDVILNPENLNNFYEQADIFLLTSVNEGMPNVILEAMSWTLPIVSTNAGDISYLVDDNKNGFICKQGDYKSISIKLLELITSEKLRQEFGENGYKKICSNFSLEHLTSEYNFLIEKYL